MIPEVLYGLKFYIFQPIHRERGTIASVFTKEEAETQKGKGFALGHREADASGPTTEICSVTGQANFPQELIFLIVFSSLEKNVSCK